MSAMAKNIGKSRYVFDRAKNYIQSVLYFVQFGMQAATVLALYTVSGALLAGIAAAIFIGIGLFVWFMRFDVNNSLPAEHGWVWSINPSYQALRKDHEEISAKIETLMKNVDEIRRSLDNDTPKGFSEE